MSSPEEHRLLIRNGRVHGRTVDILMDDKTILALGRDLGAPTGCTSMDARGGTVIPGLHDHHLHLRALAAQGASIDLAGVTSPAELDQILATQGPARGAETQRWLRATGWHEGRGGELDRWRLDRLCGETPVRVQHRTGALWVLNTSALALAGARTAPQAERDDRGELTGRLWRSDDWLRDRVPTVQDNLNAVLQDAARLGITGCTDATPGLSQRDIDEFAGREFLQRLCVMAEPGVEATGDVRVVAEKILLDDDFVGSDFADHVRRSHAGGRAVAVHCVTADQLALTVATLRRVGVVPGDRVEHAFVVPPGFAAELGALRVAVAIQPGFIFSRGEDYLRDVDPAELPWLQPCRSLLEFGVPVLGSTDAPYGGPDPWQAIATATARRTAAGSQVNQNERISALDALNLFWAAAEWPWRRRTIAPGQPADLCILTGSLGQTLAEPQSRLVSATIRGGRPIWDALGTDP